MSKQLSNLSYGILGALAFFALIGLVLVGSIVFPLLGDDFKLVIIILGGVMFVMGVIWIVVRRGKLTPLD